MLQAMLMMNSLCTLINTFEVNIAVCKYCLGTRGFEKIIIYRPGLLRLSRGRQRRRGNNFRVLEWMARQFCALFDWGDWLSISTDDLSTVMVANSLDLEDCLDGGTAILEHADIVGRMIKNLCNFSR